MASSSVLVRAEGILFFLGVVIFFAVFINLYRPPKIVSDNFVMRSREPLESLQEFASKPSSPVVVSSSNLAPQLRLSTSFKCTEQVLWGKPHAGGWMVCLDADVFPQKDPLTNTNTNTNTNVPENKNKCIVYSFGLGADWSFDNAAENSGCEVRE